jgi:hypothetical protein
MVAPLRFTTVRVGTVTVAVGGQAFESDVRVLLDANGNYRVLDGSISGALSTLRDACILAEASDPDAPDVGRQVHWREDPQVLLRDEHACPICGAPAKGSPRNANSLCPACVLELTDAVGRPLHYQNTGLSGGLEARYADNGATYAGIECFVRGLRCRAEEHRFGGVVVQLASEMSR